MSRVIDIIREMITEKEGQVKSYMKSILMRHYNDTKYMKEILYKIPEDVTFLNVFDEDFMNNYLSFQTLMNILGDNVIKSSTFKRDKIKINHCGLCDIKSELNIEIGDYLYMDEEKHYILLVKFNKNEKELRRTNNLLVIEQVRLIEGNE